MVTELNGRRFLDPNYVVSIISIYVDSMIPDTDLQRLAAVADSCKVSVVEELHMHLASIIMRKTSNNCEEKENNNFNYVLAFNFAERTLDAALKHDRIAMHPFYAKQVSLDLAKAIYNLHNKGIIHADIKPLNILKEGDIWKLTDLDVSCEIGQKFGLKPPSSGYCPPEMANIMFNASGSSDFKSYTAHISYDLWSYGVVLFNLLTGQPLWHTDQDDNITSQDKVNLKYWDSNIVEEKIHSIQSTTARNLIKKLLDPDPNDRCKHFLSNDSNYGDAMQCVMRDPFFNEGSEQEDDQIGRQVNKDSQLNEISKRANETQNRLITVSKMSTSHLIELMNMQEVLIRAEYRANKAQTPTTFVILKQKLPPPPTEEERQKLIEFITNEDDSGIAVEGAMAKQVKGWMELVAEGKSWVENIALVHNSIAEDDPVKFFDAIKTRFKDLIQKDTMYLYLIDELTGKPVRGDGYPLEITQPLEVIPKAIPLIHHGIKAMSLYNGTSGVLQMFGFPVPSVPKNVRLKNSLKILKKCNSLEVFGQVHKNVEAGNREKETVRDVCLREVTNFITGSDTNHSFAGLHRVGDHDGSAVWTKLRGETVKETLLERSNLRQVEEESEAFAAMESDLIRSIKSKELELKSERYQSQSCLCRCVILSLAHLFQDRLILLI